MTTLVSDIITDAYRESNIIAISASPTAAEIAEGLRLLNRVVANTYNSDAGEKFIDYPIGRHNINRPQGWPYYNGQPTNDWFVPLNARLLLNLDSAQTVYLNPTPEDGTMFSYVDVSGNLGTYNLVINGNGRKIEGSTSVTKNTNGGSAVYMYRADTGNWAKVSPLVSADEFPFPTDFDDLFVISLAVRLNPRHDVTTAQESVAALKKLLSQFKARYAQIMPQSSELALVLTPGMRRYRGIYDETAAFLAGNPLIYRGWR
jgi:hypothetical protein